MAVPLLEARDLVKTYPGVRALDGVSLDVLPGEVHAVVGENGAGKSTLIHVLAGVIEPDSGALLVGGQEAHFAGPQDAARAGVSVVFQELSLAPGLSIAENVLANRQPVSRLGLVSRGRLHGEAREYLGLFDWEVDPATPVETLPAARQQVVEILKALARRPRVLILDEPTSSLTAAEAEHLFANLRRLRGEGIGILYVSHHLPEVLALADRVTVLRDGSKVDTCDVRDVSEPDLIRKMVGRDIADMYGRRAAPPAEDDCFRLERGSRAGAFARVSLSVRSGEIVGLAGLAGAGRTELGRAIFGAEPLDEGRMWVQGEPFEAREPADAIARRVAYLTESRKEDGLFLDMTLRDNCAAASLSSFARGLGLMDDAAARSHAEACAARYAIAATGPEQEVATLSGGNQQKALLALWMAIRPVLLIADEPTRGVDVGARSEIYRILRDMVAGGMGVLLISSDLPELLGLCDRILVMRAGRLVGEFDAEEATEEAILACASAVGVARGGVGR